MTNLDTSAVVYSSGTINTRKANGVPDRMLLNFGFDAGVLSPNPNYRVDNFTLHANPVPEPVAVGLVAPPRPPRCWRGDVDGRRRTRNTRPTFCSG